MKKIVLLFLIASIEIKCQSMIVPMYTKSDYAHYAISNAMTVTFSSLIYKFAPDRIKNHRALKSILSGGLISLSIGWGAKEGIHDFIMKRGHATLSDFVLDGKGTADGMLITFVAIDIHERRKSKKQKQWQ